MTLHPDSAEALASQVRATPPGTRLASVRLDRLARVLEHSPEDLTVTAEAGCTLAALQAALASRGQWLPIDPPRPEQLTLAALLDTNASGPRRCGHGTIREHLIGLRVVLPDGRLIRSGGKVVKNVAGYDLLKLFVGARGSLGLIVEATFKLLPLPEAEAFVQRPCASLDEAEARLADLLDSPLTPTVLDLHQAGPGQPPTLVLGVSGPREAVDWQLAQAARLGFTEPGSLDHETRFHDPAQAAPQSCSVAPSRLIATLRALGPAPFVARAANGLILHRQPGQRPAANPDPAVAALSRRLKEIFDPHGLLPALTS
ncbi:MAG: hypothetical protein RJA22_2692 [Verrucomicrobiota bacterium]|jgi:FAD/FMN-containing dehydrogenase